MEYISIAAIAGCYLAIIGMYVWVFRQIQEVKKMVHDHTQKAGAHIDSDKLVFKEVCDQKVLRFEEKIEDVKETMHKDCAEIKEMIRNR